MTTPTPSLFDIARTRAIPAKVEGMPYVSAPAKVAGQPVTIYGWETPGDELPILDFIVLADGGMVEVFSTAFLFGGRFTVTTPQGAEFDGVFQS